MLAHLIAAGILTLLAGFCIGAASMAPYRPRKASTIDLKVARDEIEEMIAG